MGVKIIQVLELLRVEPHEFIVEHWPKDANAALYLSSSAGTLFCIDEVIDDEEMWPVNGYENDYENDYVGWHMWEHADVKAEYLKYKHLMLNGSPWIFYAYISSKFERAVRAAKEIVFRAEVWTSYAE
jgi:hypothetical protein